VVSASNEPVFTIIRNVRDFGEAAVTAGNAVANAVDVISRAVVSVGAALDEGAQTASARMSQLFAIIDSTGESAQIKLQRKLSAVATLAAELDAAYRTGVALHGGNADASDLATLNARDVVLAQQATLAGDLALLVSLQAQYGTYADQLFDLEKWRQAQIAQANGNAATLLIIEQSYADRRNAILTGGVANGLSALQTQLRQWLDKLLLNDSLSNLSPRQRLDAAAQQYNTALAGTDPAAITGAADAYLREARSFYASGGAYDAIFSAVVATISARAGGYAPTITAPAVGNSVSASTAALSTASASVATSAATTAVAAADATTQAVIDTKNLIATLIYQTRVSVEQQAQLTRDADAANTSELKQAIADRASQRVL
jgi:hypothetical protein